MFQLRMFSTRLVVACGLLFFMTAPSLADTLTYTSVTSPASPTFFRPTETGDAFGIDFDEFGNLVPVPYHVFGFDVSVSGSYSFLSLQEPGFDGFLILYANVFNPANPIANFVAANDDFPIFNIGTSAFSANLSTNTLYLLVTTGVKYSDNAFREYGSFTNTISGPGAIRPIPEPATLLLLGTGLAGAGAAVRRRRSSGKR